MRASKAKEAWEILQHEFQGDKRTRFKNNQQASCAEEKEADENMFYACQSAAEQKNNVWFLDNGCTNHMTDTIGIQTKVGTKYIRDVLLVLALEQNLLSVGQLVEHGYKLHFEDNECTIYDKERRRNLVKKIKMEKNISFPIVFKYAENVALRMEDVEEAWLWHRRFGHLNFNSLKMLCQRKMVQGLPNTIEEKNEVCDGCALGKHHRQSFPKGVAWRAKKVLELIHTDICGPMSTPSQGNNKYFVLFIDDFTRMTWVFFMKQKSEVFSIFKKFKSFVEKQSGCYIKTLRSDRGMECTSSQFGNFCEDEGVERQLTIAYTPQQNGVVERKNQTVMEMAKAMLYEKGLPKIFWAEAVNTATLQSVWVLMLFTSSKGKKEQLDETSEKCIFMGYSSQSKGYRVYNLKTNKLIISREVIFDEKAAWNWEEGKILKKTILVDELQTKAPVETGNGSTSTSSPQESPRSVPLSPSIESPTSSSVKYHSDGRVQRLKARLVAKGYSQQPGVDFHETFAPVARLDTIRTIIAVAAQKGWLLYQLDIKSAFLNGKLEEEIYVKQPQGFVVDGEENKVYKSKSEPTLYVKSKDNSQILIVALYVDDLIFTGNDEKMVEKFRNEMMKKYEMSDMGLLHYFLGIEVYQEEDGVFICQKRYVEHILKKFGMASCNPVSTPLVVNEKLRKENGGKMVDETHFRSLVGNLLYLTATRPDIMFAASLLSRFMHYPSHLHLGAAKRVLRYLQGTVELGIKYFRNIEVKLIGHCDSDWGGCIDDMKNTSGYAFSLGSGVISWVSKKQGSVAQSSAKAEYISAHWQLLKQYG
ncbi:Retrovirus-related Pol polyprotein from transposon RE1 [Vitis vinifera]|uniref:Retrovirus-related Pol polyprotein from transposon RE1 n=1 Tax=Vitis vinifera TaxID=29760 RepID=A0A438HHJ2_VITVI|nr:Retrovirus-related Pol polyprotein from transposon RE1 [Vitis vinifera]